MTELELTEPEEQFLSFLKSQKYRQRIAQLSVVGARSLVVDFEDLLTFDPSLARLIIDKPDSTLAYANRALWEQLRIEDPEYADEVARRKTGVKVRLRNLPDRIPLRVVGSEQIGRLSSIDGILVRATPVKPLLVKAVFKCRCGATTQPIDQSGTTLVRPGECPSCKRRGPFEVVLEDSVFINSQEIRIQERPEDLPPGQLPRSIDVKIEEDLVDISRPGDRVTITGIVRVLPEFLPGKGGRLRTYNLYMDANHIEIMGKEPEEIQITPEEERLIQNMAKDPRILEKIMASIAPSIYGHRDIKEAIMLLLFGGVPKSLPDGIQTRGDINVLLIGDPGTAKSQLLQYVARIAPRGLYTSGRGSSAAGLTAAVVREKTGGMVLEAGALVLSDRGVCSIDEIDKMRPEDRVSIHEAMEQQTVSVAKGGIVATLNARASILAASNPALGRYDPFRTVSENITLPVTILSRFDLIFVLKDTPESEEDSRTAEHILSLHRTGSAMREPPIPPLLLKKYIAYGRRIRPILDEEAARKFSEFYLHMRKQSGEAKDSPVAITPRQLESLVRLSEARARAALRPQVRVEDANAVIALMTRWLEQVGIDVSSGKVDIDVIMTGKPKTLRDRLQIVLSLVVDTDRKAGSTNLEEMYERLRTEFQIQRPEAEKLVRQLLTEGAIYEPRPGYVKKS
jgi:replicative DNA helicase Mcm